MPSRELLRRQHISGSILIKFKQMRYGGVVNLNLPEGRLLYFGFVAATSDDSASPNVSISEDSVSLCSLSVSRPGRECAGAVVTLEV